MTMLLFSILFVERARTDRSNHLVWFDNHTIALKYTKLNFGWEYAANRHAKQILLELVIVYILLDLLRPLSQSAMGLGLNGGVFPHQQLNPPA